MNKRRIALLAGLMTVGMVSFAMDDNAELLKKEQKPLSIFNINDRVRFDENRLEVNGNLHLNENNRLEIRVRDYTNVGNTFGSETGPGTGKNPAGDKTELRLRLHTQTSVENMEVRTELKTRTYGSNPGGSSQYFRVQPTWHLFTDVDGLDSLVRAGFGMEHSSRNGEDFSFTGSTENKYQINEYLDIEGNIYYDYTFARNSNKNHKFDIEAYVHSYFPLYNTEGLKVEALLEGGADPYSFGARKFKNLNNVAKNNEGRESYVLYVEPSVKVTKTLSERNSIYLQGGYYAEITETNNKTSDSTPTPAWKGKSDKYNGTGFVRVGFTSAF